MILGKDPLKMIKDEVKDKTYSVKDMAAYVGITANGIYSILRGETNPRWRTMVGLIEFAGYDLALVKCAKTRPIKKYEGPVRIYNKKTGKWEVIDNG